jgi:tetratricopeptide (TPR) repeat protein
MKNMLHKKENIAALLLFLLFLASPAVTMRLHPNWYEGGRSRDERSRDIRNRSAAALILGEIRSSMSDIMFIKTELYLHSGVAYKLNLDYDALSSKGNVVEKGQGKDITLENLLPPVQHDHEEHAHEHAHEHEGAESEGKDELHVHCDGADTLSPTRKKDFRGFIGELQRRVKPWQDPSKPHLHTDGTELLPWYRLMTLSDPHNIRGYMIGAWWLKHFKKKEQLQEAIKFLDEGISNNPDAFQLYLMKGYISSYMNESSQAGMLYKKAAELAIRSRPPGGKISPDWTQYQEEDALAAIRLAVFTEKEYGSADKALDLARHYLKIIGQDVILERQIGQMESNPPSP